MALQKQTYINDQTVITAEQMNAIQDAIIENEKNIAGLSAESGSSSSGASSPAIIDVSELPTGDFDKNAFYRMSTYKGYFFEDGEVQEEFQPVVVNVRPEVGVPALNDTTDDTTTYFETSTNTLLLYIDEYTASTMGMPVGWSDLYMSILDIVTTLDGYAYDTSSSPGRMVILVQSKIYHYNNGWVEVGSEDSGSSNVVIVTVDENNVASMTASEIQAELNNGKVVFLYLGGVYIKLNMYGDSPIIGYVAEPMSGDGQLFVRTVTISDDGTFSLLSEMQSVIPSYPSDSGMVFVSGDSTNGDPHWTSIDTIASGDSGSNVVFVTADIFTMKASMTGTEIAEAVDSGKIAILVNAETNSVMCTLHPFYGKVTAEGRQEFVRGNMLDSMTSGNPIDGDLAWLNTVSDSVVIDYEGNILLGDTFSMLPLPTSDDTNKIPVASGGDYGTIEWMNPSEVPEWKGADGITPHIGDNGNWFIGETDTGVAASGSGSSEIIFAIIDETAMTSSMSNTEIKDAIDSGKTVFGVTSSGSFPLSIYNNPFGGYPASGTRFNISFSDWQYTAKTFVIKDNTVTVKATSQLIPSPIGSSDAGKVPVATTSGNIEWQNTSSSKITIVNLDLSTMTADKTSTEIIELAADGKTILGAGPSGMMFTCVLGEVNSSLTVMFVTSVVGLNAQEFGTITCIVDSTGTITTNITEGFLPSNPTADDTGKVFMATGAGTAAWTDPSTIQPTLVDEVTGTSYKLKVRNGELVIEEA